MICSHFKRRGYRGQHFLVRNRSIREVPFHANMQAWCGLHQMNPQLNSTYIVQRRGSQHSTSRYHRFGQPNRERNVDPASSMRVDAYSRPAPSSSTEGHIDYFIAASSGSTIIIESSTHKLYFHRSFIVVYAKNYCWRFVIASGRRRLLVHLNDVKRHLHQAYPISADVKQALHRQSFKAPFVEGYGNAAARRG